MYVHDSAPIFTFFHSLSIRTGSQFHHIWKIQSIITFFCNFSRSKSVQDYISHWLSAVVHTIRDQTIKETRIKNLEIQQKTVNNYTTHRNTMRRQSVDLNSVHFNVTSSITFNRYKNFSYLLDNCLTKKKKNQINHVATWNVELWAKITTELKHGKSNKKTKI